MIVPLSRTQCRQLCPKLPISKYRRSKLVYPAVYKMYVLTLPSKSAKGHAKNIGLCLQKLLEGMGIGELAFMGDTNAALLQLKTGYKPVKEAIEFLAAYYVTKTFNGGIIAHTQDMYPLIQHLFWLVRTNSIAGYVYGMDLRQRILLNICQYGAIHFDTLDEGTDNLFQKAFTASGFIFREGNACFSPWQKTGMIKGRTLNL